MAVSSNALDPGAKPMIGDSGAFMEMLDLVSRLAPVDRPVLILGERGSGKELVAERLHYLSGRWDGPFTRTNCAALAEGVLDSELFGHEAGAFTGAVRRHAGRFERSSGGTLFLDEIASAPLNVQEKLLRAVEYGEIERVGGTGTLTVDVRVVAAANIDLRAEADAGRFRADLLDRLAFDVVRVPPLRDRREDIGTLIDHFGRAMAADLGWPAFPGFTESAIAAFTGHDWPGNIRELRGAVERSMVRAASQGRPIETAVLDPFGGPLLGAQPSAKGSRTPPTPSDQTQIDQDRHDRSPTESLSAAARHVAQEKFDFHAAMSAVEGALLDASLRRSGNNLKETSSYMNMSYDQLRTVMKRHGRKIRTHRTSI